MKTNRLTSGFRAPGFLLVLTMLATLAGCGGGGGGTPALSATANTTSQSLLVGTAMTSFTPLTASGGKTPYVYSYTGTLPTGLTFDSATGSVSGTPTATYTTANLVFSVKDANNTVASTTSTVSFSVTPAVVTFTNGQAAAVVIGQMDFTSYKANQGGAVGANTLDSPYSTFVNSGMLYVPDFNNNRTLVFNSIPTSNGDNANYVLGQTDLTSNAPGTSATALNGPVQLVIDNGKLMQADFYNNRVNIYNLVPASGPGTIDVVVGQPDKSSNTANCSASGLDGPASAIVVNGILLVADANNNRILIWNSIPTIDGTTADMVLGQSDFTTCAANGSSGVAGAATLNYPSGMWSDGTSLVVDDTFNNRVLIWDTLPTQNGQAADRVLGQADFTHIDANQGGAASASTLNQPLAGVFFNGTQLFIGDSSNNRVLIWNSMPTMNGQAADVVLGQGDFVTVTDNGTTETNFANPTGVFLYGKQLIVNDSGNNRALILNGQ